MGLLRGLLLLSGASYALHTRLHTRLQASPEPEKAAPPPPPVENEVVVSREQSRDDETKRPRPGEDWYPVPTLQVQFKTHACATKWQSELDKLSGKFETEYQSTAKFHVAPAYTADEATKLEKLGSHGYFEAEALNATKDFVALFVERSSSDLESKISTWVRRTRAKEEAAIKSTTLEADAEDRTAAKVETNRRVTAPAVTKEKAGVTREVEALVADLTVDSHGFGKFPPSWHPNPPSLSYRGAFHVVSRDANARPSNEELKTAVGDEAKVADDLHAEVVKLLKDEECTHSASVGWDHVSPPRCPQLETANPPCAATVGDLSAFQEIYTGTGPTANRFEPVKHIPGALGRNVRVCDMEWDYDTAHPNLLRATHPATGVGPYLPVVTEVNILAQPTVRTARDGDPDHGTAVLTMMCGQPRGPGHVGIRGMVPEAGCYWVTPRYQHRHNATSPWGAWHWDRYDLAMAHAAQHTLSPGDVYLIEAHQLVCGLRGRAGTQRNYGPIEETAAFFDAIRMLTRRGITVIEAAGNGAMDFANPGCATWRARGDSGAVIVGALAHATGNKIGFSSHDTTPAGSRVDSCALGELTPAGGYNDLIAGAPVAPFFSFTLFSGTSGASPIVTSAAVAAQGVAKAHRLAVLRPWTLRALIRSLGDPLPAGTTIGRRVNAENVVNRVLAWAHKCYFCQYATFLAIQRLIEAPLLWGRTMAETVKFTCSRLTTLAEHDMCKRYIEDELFPTLQQMVAAIPGIGVLGAVTMGGHFEALLEHYGWGTGDADIARLANLVCSASLNAVAAPGSTPVPPRPVGGVPYVPCVMIQTAVAGVRTGPNTFRAAYVANHKHLTNVHLETFA